MENESQKPEINENKDNLTSSEAPHGFPRKSFWAYLGFTVGGVVIIIAAYWGFVILFALVQLFTPWDWWGYQSAGYTNLPYKPSSTETKTICDTYFGHYSDVQPRIDRAADQIGLAPYSPAISFKLSLPSKQGLRPPSESQCYYNGRIQVTLDYGDGSERASFEVNASDSPEKVLTISHRYEAPGIYRITALLFAVRPIDNDAFNGTTTINTVGVLSVRDIPQSVINFYSANMDKGMQLTYCKPNDADYYYDAYFLGKGISTYFDISGREFARRPHIISPASRTVCVTLARHNPQNPSDEIGR